MDQLSLVEGVDRVGQCIIVTVALATTDGSMPASARCSLYLIDTYCESLSLWWTSSFRSG